MPIGMLMQIKQMKMEKAQQRKQQKQAKKYSEEDALLVYESVRERSEEREVCC